MKATAALAIALLGAPLITACTQDVQALDARSIEERYGVSGAFADTIVTSDGPLKGMLVPITLADGRTGHLFMPEAPGAADAIYLQDEQGLHPVVLNDNTSRDDVARAPVIVQAQPAPTRTNGRSWEQEVLIIGGSAGAGTAIGAIAGGKKGAGVGAAVGGIGGLIYDLATRNK